MRLMDEQTTETLHLFVVPEDQLPKKPDYLSILLVALACLCLSALIGLSVFSAASDHEVSFTISIPLFHLAPVSKTVKTTVIATGKGHTPATYAHGIITFYNGLPSSLIIPIGTRLTGRDGISVITDQEAVIPPVVNTIPPTDGRTNVLAHSVLAGEKGNIPAGDINVPCCITSVIAQNPYKFMGGRDARDFTYLSQEDVTKTIAPLLPTLRAKTLFFLPNPQLNPTCSTATTSSPGVGKETMSAQLTIVETCSAETYSVPLVVHTASAYSKHFGKGTLTHIEFFEVGVKNEVVLLYVVGRFVPFEARHSWAGK
jgi:hypothetical protein